MTAGLRQITVVPDSLGSDQGTLLAGGLRACCALGRTGITRDKHEGDGATPAGSHRLVGVLYRPDHVRRPVTRLPVSAITSVSGWCDDPADRNYNRPVRLPYPASHERLWRDDRLYDLVVVLDYNLAHPIPGKGSAIFLHLAAPDFAPTAGCVAVGMETLRRILVRAGLRSLLTVK